MSSGLSGKTEAGSSWLSLMAQGQFRQAAFPELHCARPRASGSQGHGFLFTSCWLLWALNELASVGPAN